MHVQLAFLILTALLENGISHLKAQFIIKLEKFTFFVFFFLFDQERLLKKFKIFSLSWYKMIYIQLFIVLGQHKLEISSLRL